MYRMISVLVLGALLGCSDGGFSGDGGKHAARGRKGATADGTSADGKANQNDSGSPGLSEGSGGAVEADDGASAVADGDAIAVCLANWGAAQPFGAHPKFRKIEPQGLAGAADVVLDTSATKEPELILLSAEFGTVGASVYQLQNPNGWYCVDVAFGAMGSSAINVTCDAHLTATHSGGDLAKGVTISRVQLLPPMPCLDAKDPLVSIDTSVLGKPLVSASNIVTE